MVKAEQINELVATAREEGVQKFVAGAFIVKDGALLIVKRATSDDFLPELREIPSGGVDPDESVLQALHREIMEETALRILEVSRYANYFDYVSSSGKKTRQLNFLVKTDGHDVRLDPSEHSEYEWVKVGSDRFKELNLSPETRACICAYEKEISSAKDAKWITIDGVDGVGKSTQLKSVKKKLSDEFQICCIEEFSSSVVGSLIREIIKEKKFFGLERDGQTIRTETLLLLTDWLHKCENEFLHFAKDADLIVSDRGLLSLIAYQASRLIGVGFQPREAICWVEDVTRAALYRSKIPDLNLVLTLPIKEIEQRCISRGDNLSRTDLQFLEITQGMMRRLAAEPGNRAEVWDVSGIPQSDLTAMIVKKARALLTKEL